MRRTPLADRLRPESFDEIVGQRRLFGEGGAVRRMCERGYITNMIFWGPPGTGKTTAARIIAKTSGMTLRTLNATTATTADIREATSQSDSIFGSAGVLLYLDEIQYFSKKQQQSLLEFIEDGRVTLIASTTENPRMYVYNAILSRSSSFEFKAVEAADIVVPLRRGLELLRRDLLPATPATTLTTENSSGEAENEKKASESETETTLKKIAECGGGDVRRAINLLEGIYLTYGESFVKSDVSMFTDNSLGASDKDGTSHYDLLSALQKSIRGSDPDAAIFYLCRILESGDLTGACRRLLVIASEDIGCAYPTAAILAHSCTESALKLGMPEASLPLSQLTVTLATSPKSNSAHIAYEAAREKVASGAGQLIPPYMRPSNDYEGYKYPHDYKNHYVAQRYLPSDLDGTRFYAYGDNKTEQAAKEYWDKIKGERK